MKTEQTAFEIAEPKRKEELAAKLKRMDDTEVKLYAQKIGADITAAKDRADMEAAIELKEEDTAKAAAFKAAIEAEDAAQARAVATEADKRDPTERILRALNAEFCRDIPASARSGGFEPDDNDPRFGGDYDVANGRYRVSGSEYYFDIKGKKLVSAERAVPPDFGGER